MSGLGNYGKGIESFKYTFTLSYV